MSQSPPTEGQKVYWRQAGTFQYNEGYYFTVTGGIAKMAANNDPTSGGPLVDNTMIDWVAAP